MPDTPESPPPASAPPPPPDDAPPPTVAPEVLAGLSLLRRRYALLDQRISAWDDRLRALEAIAEERPAPPAEGAVRLADLAARLGRLERLRARDPDEGEG